MAHGRALRASSLRLVARRSTLVSIWRVRASSMPSGPPCFLCAAASTCACAAGSLHGCTLCAMGDLTPGTRACSRGA